MTIGIVVGFFLAVSLTGASFAVLRFPDRYLRFLRWTSRLWTSLLPQRVQRLRETPTAKTIVVLAAAVTLVVMAAAAWIGLVVQIARAISD